MDEQQLEGIGTVFDTTVYDESFESLWQRWTCGLGDYAEPTLELDECSQHRQVTHQAFKSPSRSSSSSRAQQFTATRSPRQAYVGVRRSPSTRHRRSVARAQPTPCQSQPATTGSLEHGAISPGLQNAINQSYSNDPLMYTQTAQAQARTPLHPRRSNPAASTGGYYQYSRSPPTGPSWPVQPNSPFYPTHNQGRNFNGFPNQFDRPTNQAFAPPSLDHMATQSFPPGPGTPMIHLNDQVPRQAFFSTEPRNIADLVQATTFGGHRHPPPSNSQPTAQPTIGIAGPSTPSIITTSSMNTATSAPRRSGDALRDPNLPYRCDQCGKTFSKSDELRRHISRTHNSDRALQCPSCDQTFLYPKDLRRHSGTHLEQRESFVCPECQKSYTREDNLQRHVTRSHAGSIGADSAYVSMSRTGSERSGMSM